MIPRKRNKKDGKPITRAEEDPNLPTNKGVHPQEYTKEDQWAGEVDRDYGEFYKKMAMSERRVSKEAVLFGQFFNFWRKTAYALSIVFYHENFRF